MIYANYSILILYHSPLVFIYSTRITLATLLFLEPAKLLYLKGYLFSVHGMLIHELFVRLPASPHSGLHSSVNPERPSLPTTSKADTPPHPLPLPPPLYPALVFFTSISVWHTLFIYLSVYTHLLFSLPTKQLYPQYLQYTWNILVFSNFLLNEWEVSATYPPLFVNEKPETQIKLGPGRGNVSF